MKVVNEYDGERPKLKSIIMRNIYRLISLEILVYLFGGSLWHDKWTDTIVIDMQKFEAALELEGLGKSVDIGFDN